MIFRKGEIVRVKESSLLNENIKRFAGFVGRVIKVKQLEFSCPFVVEFISGSDKVIHNFSHEEIFIIGSNLKYEQDLQNYKIQNEMYKLSGNV